MEGHDFELFHFLFFLEMFVLEYFFFFVLIQLFKFHELIHMVSDLFFGVHSEIADKLILDFEIVFALAPVPNFNKIAMVLLIPT